MTRASLCVMVFLAAGWLAAPAHAATDAWLASPSPCGGIARERGSGQMDGRGWFYIACSKAEGSLTGDVASYPSVRIFDPAGRLRRIVPLQFAADGSRQLVTDVAPSPDGAHLYVIRYDTKVPYRLNRQADGGYALDPAWQLADFAYGGMWRPRGEFLATDGAGNVYMTMGLWSPGTPITVAKYRPDGSFVTRFGQQVSGSWALGDFHGAAAGLSVTADGARVFVADVNNSRIQRFDRQATGAYMPVLAMGAGAGNSRDGWCGRLSAPYDVALTPGGELVAISTACYGADGGIEVFRYSQSGQLRGIVTTQATSGDRVHGIGVDRTGLVHLVEGSIVVRPGAGWSDAGADAGGGGPMGGAAVADPGDEPPTGEIPGAPDTSAPTLDVATAPAATASAAITLTLAASDNRGVAQFRVAEDGQQYAWRAWSGAPQHVLSGGPGEHVLVVQVRDAAGNVSAGVTVRVRQTAAAAVPVATGGGGSGAGGRPVVGGGTVGAVPAGQHVADGDTAKPSIVALRMPAQVQGRRLTLTLSARDDRGATQVRFATEAGRWGSWQPVRGRRTLLLSAGAGWKGVFAQVRDAAGNVSRPWFQTALMAPRGAGWKRGTSAADRLRLGAGTGHADLSGYDGRVDRVACGAGVDTVLLQPGDVAARDCERVVRVVTPSG